MSVLVQAYLPADMQDYAESFASNLKDTMLSGDSTLKEGDVDVVVIPIINKAAVIVVSSEGTVSFLHRGAWKNNLADSWEEFLHTWPGFKGLGMKILVFGEQTDINPFSHPI